MTSTTTTNGRPIFEGCMPALMTPCDEKGNILYDALVAIGLEMISQGMRAVVYCGSMGDWPLLTVSEKAGFGYSNGELKVEGLRRQSRDNKRPGPSGVKVGPWVHVACVYEGSRKPSHIYVDGKLVNSVYWSAYFARPDFQMKIGKEFGGGIARMRMWRGVKSAEEIAKMAKAAHGRVVVDENVRK